MNEKEESCHELEAEVVDLRKKVEKSNKFLNSSTILNVILDSQTSSNDQSSLGYSKEATHVEASTSKKHEVSPSLSKDGHNVASQPSTQGNENFHYLSLHNVCNPNICDHIHYMSRSDHEKHFRTFDLVSILKVSLF